MTDEVTLKTRMIEAVIVYERLSDSLMKGRKAGSAPVLMSVTKCPAIKRTRAFRFIVKY